MVENSVKYQRYSVIFTFGDKRRKRFFPAKHIVNLIVISRVVFVV